MDNARSRNSCNKRKILLGVPDDLALEYRRGLSSSSGGKTTKKKNAERPKRICIESGTNRIIAYQPIDETLIKLNGTTSQIDLTKKFERLASLLGFVPRTKSLYPYPNLKSNSSNNQEFEKEIIYCKEFKFPIRNLVRFLYDFHKDKKTKTNKTNKKKTDDNAVDDDDDNDNNNILNILNGQSLRNLLLNNNSNHSTSNTLFLNSNSNNCFQDGGQLDEYFNNNHNEFEDDNDIDTTTMRSSSCYDNEIEDDSIDDGVDETATTVSLSSSQTGNLFQSSSSKNNVEHDSSEQHSQESSSSGNSTKALTTSVEDSSDIVVTSNTATNTGTGTTTTSSGSLRVIIPNFGRLHHHRHHHRDHHHNQPKTSLTLRNRRKRQKKGSKTKSTTTPRRHYDYFNFYQNPKLYSMFRYSFSVRRVFPTLDPPPAAYIESIQSCIDLCRNVCKKVVPETEQIETIKILQVSKTTINMAKKNSKKFRNPLHGSFGMDGDAFGSYLFKTNLNFLRKKLGKFEKGVGLVEGFNDYLEKEMIIDLRDEEEKEVEFIEEVIQQQQPEVEEEVEEEFGLIETKEEIEEDNDVEEVPKVQKNCRNNNLSMKRFRKDFDNDHCYITANKSLDYVPVFLAKLGKKRKLAEIAMKEASSNERKHRKHCHNLSPMKSTPHHYQQQQNGYLECSMYKVKEEEQEEEEEEEENIPEIGISPEIEEELQVAREAGSKFSFDKIDSYLNQQTDSMVKRTLLKRISLSKRGKENQSLMNLKKSSKLNSKKVPPKDSSDSMKDGSIETKSKFENENITVRNLVRKLLLANSSIYGPNYTILTTEYRLLLNYLTLLIRYGRDLESNFITLNDCGSIVDSIFSIVDNQYRYHFDQYSNSKFEQELLPTVYAIYWMYYLKDEIEDCWMDDTNNNDETNEDRISNFENDGKLSSEDRNSNFENDGKLSSEDRNSNFENDDSDSSSSSSSSSSSGSSNSSLSSGNSSSNSSSSSCSSSNSSSSLSCFLDSDSDLGSDDEDDDELSNEISNEEKEEDFSKVSDDDDEVSAASLKKKIVVDPEKDLEQWIYLEGLSSLIRLYHRKVIGPEKRELQKLKKAKKRKKLEEEEQELGEKNQQKIRRNNKSERKLLTEHWNLMCLAP